MKPKTAKKDEKRTFEVAVNTASALCLQTREDAGSKVGKVKKHSLRKKFSSELVCRVIESIKEL